MSNGDCRIGDNGTVAACIDPISGSADPSAGAGVEANPGTLYVRTTGGITSYWIKTGAADTAWAELITQAFSGTLSAARFKATGAGTSALPAFALANEEGIYQEATNQLSVAVGGVRYVRLQSALLSVLNGSFSSAQNVTIGQYLISASAQASNLAELTPFKTNDLSLGSVSILRITTSDEFQILTSITGGGNGRDLIVVNANAVGGDPVTLQHDNGVDGTAANRLLHAGGLDNVIQAGGASVYRYSSDSRWRLLLP